MKNNLKLRYTLGLGGFALTSFLCLAASGVLLMFYYVPSPDTAYSSVLFIEEHVFGGTFIRRFHKISGHFYLIFIFLHTLRVVFTGAFAYRRYNWIVGMFLLLLAVCSGYTGYLLPMDQLAYWATRTGTELISQILPEHFAGKLITPDGVGGSLTLIRFYAMHVSVIPLCTIILLSLHFYRIRKDKGILPYVGKYEYIPSSPSFFRIIIAAAVSLLVLTALLSFFTNVPLLAPAEPYNAPNPSKSAWFLLWIQELVSYHVLLIFPVLLLFLGFCSMPFFVRKDEPYAKWSFKRFLIPSAVTLSVFLFIVILTLIAYYLRAEYWQIKL
jgi:quinol-cytochrome oxidoreductase complex cytochrome b subunit